MRRRDGILTMDKDGDIFVNIYLPVKPEERARLNRG